MTTIDSPQERAIAGANLDALGVVRLPQPITAEVEGATPEEVKHWRLCEEINTPQTWKDCADMWRDTALMYRKLLKELK